MNIVALNHVRKEVSNELLFESEQFGIPLGRVTGVIGDNGVGKTTFLKMLMGEDLEYEGELKLNGQYSYVPQMNQYEKKSGGEQVLEMLKVAISSQKDILLLDEPTANLDKESIEWLINSLKKFRGSVLFVSHDRAFLERVADNLIVIKNKKLTFHNLSYKDYVLVVKQNEYRQNLQYRQYLKEVKRLSTQVEDKKIRAKRLAKRNKKISNSDWKVNSRMGSYDSQSKSMAKAAKAIENRIEKMVKPDKPHSKRILKFKSIGYLKKNVHTLIRIEEGVLSSDLRMLFSYPIIEVRSTDKIILEGRNKTGKTTFVEALYDKGIAGYYSSDLSIGYFKQNIHNLDDELTILENVMCTSVQDKKTIINLIAKTGIAYEKINCKVKYLSGGEKVKVSLVKTLSCDANLLILDEPTNFLDLMALEALEEFLNSYEGAFILISHDGYLLERVHSNKILEIRDMQLNIIENKN